MIGKNAIRVIYGDNPKQMVTELLEVMKPEEEIDKNALVGIKPNLVVAKPSSLPAQSKGYCGVSGKPYLGWGYRNEDIHYRFGCKRQNNIGKTHRND